MQNALIRPYISGNKEKFTAQNNLEERLSAEFKDYAEYLGRQGLPRKVGEFATLVIQKIKTTIQHEINLNYQRCSPITARSEVKSISEDADKDVKQLETEKFDEERNNKTLRVTLSKFKINSRKKFYFIVSIVFLILMAIGEGVLAYPAFRNKLPIPASIVGALFVAFLVGFVGHQCARTIKNIEEKFSKYIAYLVVLVLYGACFFLVSIFRVENYSQVYDFSIEGSISQQIDTIPAWVLATFSLMAFWGCIVITMNSIPTDEESVEFAEYKKVKRDLAASNEKLKKLNADLTEKRTTSRARVKEITSDYETAATNEYRLVSFADVLLALFIDRNMQFRSDSIPGFYTEPHILKFQTYFNNTQNSEK